MKKPRRRGAASNGVQQNTWITAEVREALKDSAESQYMTPGKLGGLLIEWGLKQMREAGGTFVDLMRR